MAAELSKDLIEKVRVVLADTFVLYMKTYAVHWNFTGPNFFSVHKLTEQQYEELAEAVDTIAERLRALGHEAPISLESILKKTDVSEIKKDDHGQQMLAELVEGHRHLSKHATQVAIALDEAGDVFGHDLMAARVGDHDKAAWMLGSCLRKP